MEFVQHSFLYLFISTEEKLKTYFSVSIVYPMLYIYYSFASKENSENKQNNHIFIFILVKSIDMN